MRVEIENIKIAESIGILEKLNLKGLKSIHRTRLASELNEKLQRVVEEQDELRKEHCNLDEEDKPIVKEDGNLDVKDKEAFNEVMTDFLKEKVVIDGGDSQAPLRTVKKALEDSDIEWHGKESYSFEYLYSSIQGDEIAEGEGLND